MKRISCLSFLLLLLVVGFPHRTLAQQGQPHISPLGRAARSVVVPGWGQWRNGDENKGTTFFFLAVAGVILGSGAVSFSSTDNGQQFEQTVGWALYGVTTLTSVYDAFRVAERINRENGYEVEPFERSGVRLSLLRVRFDLPAP